MDKIPDFVSRRLNSIIKQVSDIEQFQKKPSFDQVEIVWNAYSELHQNILENMETRLGEFFPDYKPHNVQYSSLLLELTKTRVRELNYNISMGLLV